MTDRIPAFWKEGFYSVFNTDKAIAALSRFLELKGGKADFYYLNKMIYLLERKSLLERGTPIIFDRLCLMPYGPVPSNVYDELKDIRQMGGFANWATSFNFPEHRVVELIGSYDEKTLSRYEKKSIEQISQDIEKDLRLSTLPTLEAFNALHEYMMKLPEYVHVEKGSFPLSYKMILKKNNVSERDIDSILNEIEHHTQLALVLAL